MFLPDFARFFVRFNSASFAFWAIYTAIDLPPNIRNYSILHEVPSADALAARDLATIILKIALQLLIALVLLVKTDQVINLFSKGYWTKEPNRVVGGN